ncbi:S24 family peptidase [Gracilibacillus sp. JCM 18860]|uniref:S24 family peptidase n=1 Tax=Gracilibacillus sp. JCM 18860 TaxID=1306159 RepID=UPI0006D27724
MDNFYKELGKRINYYRKASGETLEQLGKKIGVGKSTIRKYEKGMIKVSHDRLEQIAKALDVDVSLLYGEEISNDVVDVPLYGSISCGDGGAVIFEEKEGGYVTSPKDWVDKGLYFYLTAQGDSMIGAKIHEGDLLLIQRTEEVENGEIAAVVVENECVLKRVYRENGSFTLVSENPNYKPIHFNPSTDKNIRIIGKLKKAITQF